MITGFTTTLLRANGIEPMIDELMEICRMASSLWAHAAVLASRAGCELLVEFASLRLMDVPIPDRCSFESAGQNALAKLGVASPIGARCGGAFERADKEAFGRLQCESQLSLRGDLRVSCPEFNEWVAFSSVSYPSPKARCSSFTRSWRITCSGNVAAAR